MKTQRLSAAAVIGLVLLLYSTGAAAQLTNQGMLDQVVTAFATRAASWQTVIKGAATWLYWTLVTISLVWTGGTLLLRGGGIQEFFSELVRFIMFTGFFWWLLDNGPAFASSIIQSLQLLGERASGVSSVTPSGIVDIGFMIWRQAITNLSIWSPVDSIVGLTLSAAIMVLLAAVAVNMMLVLVSAWILMYAGIFFLGFGGSRWTSDMSISYYKTVLGVGMQLLTMVILVGIGVDLLNTFYAKMNKGTLNFDELGVMMVFCVTLLMLITRVPPLVASIVSGGGVGAASSIGSSVGAGTVVGAAMAGASVASAAASMAGGAMMGAAQNMAGGASAIKAAFAAANAGGGESAGAMAAPAAGGASSGGMAAGGAGGGSSGDTAGSTPFAQAAGFSESLGGGGSSMAGGSDTQQASSGEADAKGGGDAGRKAQARGQAGGAGATQAGGQTSGSSMAGRMATAAAKAGKVAAGTGANLAAGIGSVMAAKADQMAASFQAGVEQTVGGKVATAIRQVADAPSFGGDSISAPAGDAEEIAAFVNRPETRA
ncbi:MAG: P-type conjugative transfer protein TrbL [Aquabacterium sp.]|jgi:type IV secretion system protein TrbL|uniref:P-type conjugative transfer protein TrbL n=1 Tax=Aquabacterium sp. TaxID=1872578 RepID=UPI003BB17A13